MDQTRQQETWNYAMQRLLSSLILAFALLAPAGAAIEFDGVDDYVDLGSANQTDITSNLTVSAWINRGSINTYDSVVSKDDGTNRNYQLWIANSVGPNANKVYFSVFTSNVQYDAISNNVISADGWHHLVGVHNGTNVLLYVDGILQTTQANTASIDNDNVDLWIGDRSDGGVLPFDGQIDDVRIYNRALSSTEIETLYKSERKRIGGNLANGLVAHYEMNDKEIGRVAGQVHDSSGNDNHGTFVGFDDLVANGFSTDVPANIGHGTSLEFDGVDDYVITESAGFDPTNSWTISSWVKADTFSYQGGNDRHIISQRDGAGLGRTLLALEQSTNKAFTYIGGTYTRGDAALGTDTWYHIVVVYDNASGKAVIYTNGSAGTENSVTPDAASGSFVLGANKAISPLGLLDGTLDDIHIYDKALSASEVSFLYDGSGADPGTANLVGHWDLDDSAVKDSSGNANHGIGSGEPIYQ